MGQYLFSQTDDTASACLFRFAHSAYKHRQSHFCCHIQQIMLSHSALCRHPTFLCLTLVSDPISNVSLINSWWLLHWDICMC